jgi:hypothetical protein
MLELLQRRVANPPAGPNQMDPAIGIAVVAFYVVLIGIGIAVQIFFLLSLSRCLQQVAPRNRQMEPGMVWLNLIPCFSLVWMILTIIRISDSLRDEYEDRGLRGDGDFGRSMGIIYYVSQFVCGPVALVFFIMYWVKIAGYTKELSGSGRRPGRDDYDDEEDRPRRRRRDEDEYDDR